MSQEDINILENISLRNLREKVEEIKSHLPTDARSIITYSKNFTLSLSNYCQNFCGYCFYNFKIPKVKGEENVVLLEHEQMQDIIQRGIFYNCKEALIMSGERPDYYKEVKEELKKRVNDNFIEFVKDISHNLLDLNLLPHTNIGTLTFNELKQLKNYNASMGLMLESTSMKLLKKGGVHEQSPGKIPENRIKHIINAGKLKIPFTTGLLLGIGESFDNRVKDLYLIKKIHDSYGHIQEVIIQNFVDKPGIPYRPKTPIMIEDILRVVGIARIIFENEIAIQVPPNLISGYEKEFIEMGIDDFGGISPLTSDYINPEKQWPHIDDLKHICESKGFILKERLPIYDIFIQRNGFCPENIKKTIDFINNNNGI
ncbi:MAG: 7,8-didemethyl-8-hydroxy-5-deazariboflavin synthase subunit CofG [Candidatus Lokiarchaeota archaeon]|nr:7,8-didemethyl-8-hydroxy-5-deazariboflavin synthase subunit CofG [Candidatus Lokiarchaeota archaeon]